LKGGGIIQGRLQDIDFGFFLFLSLLDRPSEIVVNFRFFCLGPQGVYYSHIPLNIAIIVRCFLLCSHSIAIPLLSRRMHLLVTGIRGYSLLNILDALSTVI